MGKSSYYSCVVLVLSLMIAVGLSLRLPPRPVVFIPTLYVTSEPEAPKPKQAVMYVANICNTKVYTPYMVIARVNMPNGWRPFIGVVAKIEVCATPTCDAVLCSNYINGVFNGQHNCSVAYNVSYEQIYVRVTAGNAPNMAWTVAIEFAPKFPRKRFVKNKEIRWLDIPEPIAENQILTSDIKVLVQFALSSERRSVPTLDRLDFSMSFCPDNQTLQRYSIDVTVTGLDSRSFMATYVCLPPNAGDLCTPETAISSDACGCAINFVSLRDHGALKDIYITVVGWGDGAQINNFIIGANINYDNTQSVK